MFIFILFCLGFNWQGFWLWVKCSDYCFCCGTFVCANACFSCICMYFNLNFVYLFSVVYFSVLVFFYLLKNYCIFIFWCLFYDERQEKYKFVWVGLWRWNEGSSEYIVWNLSVKKKYVLDLLISFYNIFELKNFRFKFKNVIIYIRCFKSVQILSCGLLKGK